MSMKLALVGTCALLAALAVGVLSAQAADVTVGLGACFFQQGGQTTVPAGSTITLRLRNFEANRGMVRDYVQAQQTTFSLNGGAPIDLSGDYSAPAFLNGLWFTETTYATGVTLASAGNSLTVDFAVTLSRNFVEQFNGPLSGLGGALGALHKSMRPLFAAPGSERALVASAVLSHAVGEGQSAHLVHNP